MGTILLFEERLASKTCEFSTAFFTLHYMEQAVLPLGRGGQQSAWQYPVPPRRWFDVSAPQWQYCWIQSAA
jgi:hypothetical protein